MSYVLGITGGIASGKSTVVDLFKPHYPVVDGDLVAREVVKPNTAGLKSIVAHFGTTILLANGELDRKKLGDIIFNDPLERKQLDKILNPFIRSAIVEQIEHGKKSSPLVIVDIPLLYEGKYERYMDGVAVVYVTPQVQKNRLMVRNQLSEKQALARINSQMALDEKKERADFVFDNNGSKKQTKTQVQNWLFEHGFS